MMSKNASIMVAMTLPLKRTRGPNPWEIIAPHSLTHNTIFVSQLEPGSQHKMLLLVFASSVIRNIVNEDSSKHCHPGTQVSLSKRESEA
ncbi:hypothetical protein TNCV_3581171 [Trichonephila clavipes]|nr:hypothetical protein TNCV_3581171 [Trichonephila clavipes]